MKNMFRSIAIAAAILIPSVVFAQDSISGLEFLGIKRTDTIGDMLSALYVYGVGFVALAAFVMFTIGGAMYIFSGDRDPGRAKGMMKNAFWGLVLVLVSWVLLYTINPDFVRNIGDPRLQMLGISPGQERANCVVGSTNSAELCTPPFVCTDGTCQNPKPTSATCSRYTVTGDRNGCETEGCKWQAVGGIPPSFVCNAP